MQQRVAGGFCDAPLAAVLTTDGARKLRQERFASALLVL
jgi:hypothetical protein